MIDDPQHDHMHNEDHRDNTVGDTIEAGINRAKDSIEETAEKAGDRIKETAHHMGNELDRKTNDNPQD